MSGGGGGGNTTTVQKADPWAGAQPHLSTGYEEAQRLFETGGPAYFPGQTYVNRDPLENAAQQQLLAFSQGGMQNQANALGQANMAMLNAPDVASNPYVTGMADTIQRRMNQNLIENQLPAIKGGAMGAGAVGGSRQGLAEGMAVRGTNEAMGDALAQLYGNAYNSGLEQQARGVGFAPQTMQAQMSPFETMAGVGAYNRGEQELALQDQLARFEYEQNLPYTNLQNYMAIVNGAPWGSTANTDVGGTSRGFNAMGALGGGMMGASAAGALSGTALGASMGSALGPVGIIGGALLGGLLS